nr:evasin-1-like [Dermacentor andersoni]
MNTFIYVAATSFALLVASELQIGDSSDDYFDYGPVGCPFPVAENKSGFGTPIACTQDCNNGTETAPNGTRCFTIGEDGFGRMVPDYPYACPLGECQNGTCVPNGMNDTCYKRALKE